MATNHPRVVITGLGALTPIGNTAPEFWQNAIAGTSGAGPVTRFDASQHKTTFACEVKNFEPGEFLNRKLIGKTDAFAHYALVVAGEALADSGLDLSTVDPYDAGVIWGTGQGGFATMEQQLLDNTARQGNPKFSPFFIPKFIANMAGGMIASQFGLQGINYSTISACASSNTAIMDAFNYIRLGKAKVVVAGGSDFGVTPASMGGFTAMRALSTRNEEPQAASRPFDAARDGFVMGEGGGALIIEDYEHAKARGAKVYAEIAGTAMTTDTYHMTTPHPEGVGAAKAMELALAEAGAHPSDIDYLNAHATSTGVGDLSEIIAIANVFGNAANNLHISGTKSMTGHLLGAAGAIEAILCIKAIENGIVPPTINTTTLDERVPAGLNIVTGHALHTPVNMAMSNTFGFGGHNAITIFKKLAGA